MNRTGAGKGKMPAPVVSRETKQGKQEYDEGRKRKEA